MLRAMALKTGTGPGTIVGGNTQARTSQTASRLAMERTLGNVFITNEILRNNLNDTVADDVMNQLQVVVLQSDLVGIPCFDEVRSHLLTKKHSFRRIVHLNACCVFVPHFGMRVNVEKGVFVRLQVVANDVAVSFGEFLVRRHSDVCRRASTLMCFILRAEIEKHPIAVLREGLDRFDGAEQRGVDVPLSEKFGQGRGGCSYQLDIMKEIDPVPVARNDGKKCEGCRARTSKGAQLFAFQIAQRFDRRVLSDENHVDRRENAIDHDQVLALAPRRSHRRETTKSDIHFSLGNHEMEI